jgi:L-arabonate dehydrase
VLKELDTFLHADCITVNGKTIKDNYASAGCYNREMVATSAKPFNPLSGVANLRGNLCENGRVIKPSAASQNLLRHKGKAVVFEHIEDYHSRIDDPALDVDETSVLVLRNVGPKGYPGMPEVGNMAIPKKLLAKGVTDMVRISDRRMSGTGLERSYCMLHPKARWVEILRSSGMATSFNSTCPPGPC